MTDQNEHGKTLGVILAGGLSRRMEGPEKSLMMLDDKPLIARAFDRLKAQIGEIIINANGDGTRFEFMGKPVQADTVEGFAGPLAGILAGMLWAKVNRQDCQRVISIPVDTPFFPTDLVERFEAELRNLPEDEQDQSICLAYSSGNRHPVFGSWPIALAEELENFLVKENERKVMLFVQRFTLIKVDFPMHIANDETLDPFFNINTQADLKRAEQIIETNPL
jgi:molybdopterin-guanine dinucleotide biosynthesis protein A